ncbi:MAG: FTR1 family iron permease [Desulfobacter sp.]|nr:MAG: FTR1 family iron permease [Desulfobacter sp.]
MRQIIILFLLAAVLACSALTVPAWAKPKQGVTEDYAPVVSYIIEQGENALEAYSPASGVITGNKISRLYFDVFETTGMEFTLGLKDNAFMLQIESKFSMLISQAMRGDDKAKLMASWGELKTDLTYAVDHYSSGEKMQTFWGRATQSFIILFREGIEAMLVVAALVAYLRRSGYSDKVKIIWHGVAWALAASVAAAWALNSLINASGAGQEAIEGVTMLIASFVLVYVSYWLTAKKDADRWQAFIKEKMDDAMGKGSLFALGLVSFLAVFREGAETILFYQALIAGTTGELTAIWSGMAIAAAGLVAVYLLVRYASIRLPIGLFFGGTAALLFAMAFVFTGQGIMELQVSTMIPTSRLQGWPMITWLGIFPTLETLVGQAMVLAVIPAGWVWIQVKKKKAVAAA